MRPAEVVRRGAGYLERHGVDQPLATAETLLASILGSGRTGLYLREEELSTAEAKRFGRALCRRCTGTPVQHLTGEQGFRRLVLAVRPGVFIPRPETEMVVDVALEAVAGLARPSVVDVGTGTGAIALSIASEHPGARVIATDCSLEAVALAREHAERLGLDVDVRCGDLLAPVSESDGALDLVVSNPPYVERGDVPGLPLDVQADPSGALVGGIDVYERLFAQASERLRPGGAIVVEIGDDRAAAVTAALLHAGFVTTRVRPDLTGRDRVVEGRRP
ncbi:MAG: peptide chain release factor N(5)-glutamine methyltransferase [Actinomycetota bacterium]